MASTARYLPIYLNDHLAAETAGAELARRISGAASGDLAELMEQLAIDLEEDRRVLRELMRTLDIGEDKVKVFAGFAGEKLGRLKLNGHFVSASPLSRLTELEALALIIEGRRLLWRTMLDLGYDELDFEALEQRAARQRDAIEPYRLKAARSSLAP